MPSDEVLEAQMDERRHKPRPVTRFGLLLRDMRQFKGYGFDRLHRTWLYLAYVMGQTAENETRIYGGDK